MSSIAPKPDKEQVYNNSGTLRQAFIVQFRRAFPGIVEFRIRYQLLIPASPDIR